MTTKQLTASIAHLGARVCTGGLLLGVGLRVGHSFGQTRCRHAPRVAGACAVNSSHDVEFGRAQSSGQAGPITPGLDKHKKADPDVDILNLAGTSFRSRRVLIGTPLGPPLDPLFSILNPPPDAAKDGSSPCFFRVFTTLSGAPVRPAGEFIWDSKPRTFDLLALAWQKCLPAGLLTKESLCSGFGSGLSSSCC